MSEAPLPEPHVIIVGGDTLALRVCEELMQTQGQTVVVIWTHGSEFATKVERTGARYVRGYPVDEDTLRAAEVERASAIVALTEDDELNLQTALRARDLSDRIRIVMRQFNRTLGRKIEQNLTNCSVVSISSHSAATYASSAVDPHCYFGVQFPDIDGPLVGFTRRYAEEYGVTNVRVAAVERTRGVRIVAVNDDLNVDAERILRADDLLVVVTQVRPVRRVLSAPRKKRRFDFGAAGELGARALEAFARADRVVRTAVVAALAIMLAGTVYFTFALHVEPATALYFVMTTMTTTGYGDITPARGDAVAEFAAVGLMFSGLTFTGIFIAILTSKFNEIQFRETQGLREVKQRGHVVVCGSGNVGSRVIDFLYKMEVPLVVVELDPSPETVARAKLGHYVLLTGNAATDTTLDLCNLGEAEAVVALTHTDTLNLEIALSARARNDKLPIVLRVGGGSFAHSIAQHFHIYRTHGMAALAAPVLAGLARFPGVRGRVTIAGRPYAISEYVEDGSVSDSDAAMIPLAVWHDRALCTIRDFSEARHGDRVLFAYPVWQYRKDEARAEREESIRVALPPRDVLERALAVD